MLYNKVGVANFITWLNVYTCLHHILEDKEQDVNGRLQDTKANAGDFPGLPHLYIAPISHKTGARNKNRQTLASILGSPCFSIL